MTTIYLQHARDFAIKAHGDQRYGGFPYVLHLDDTYEIVRRFNLHPALEVMAYLHDVLEDTSVTFEELKKEFSWQIADVVRKVTDELGKNRKERHLLTYPKTRTDPVAVALKLCDRIANVQHCLTVGTDRLSMYKKEHAEFKKALYRPDEWEDIWNYLDRLIGDKTCQTQLKPTVE
jgi:(p)ppGpp synthase/HD superfamily hydrolase